MTTSQLTATQHAVLTHAINHADGKINWFPENIKGGARKKVLDALLNRALIINDGTHWIVAAGGYEVLGLPRRGPITLAALDAVIANAETAQTDVDPELEAAVTAIEATARAEAKKPRTRDNSKQASVIAMLKRPEGATIAQIVDATGWQAHTVRGTFAGAFKKKLGLTIVSDKALGGERVYRIA